MTCKLNINFRGAVGDILCLSAAVHDLLKTNPQCQLAVTSPFSEVFQGYGLLPVDKTFGNVHITWEHYAAAVNLAKTTPQHVVEFFHRILAELTGLDCPVFQQTPKLYGRYLPERGDQPRPYWLLFAGGKSDIPVKLWSHEGYQQVVNFLRGKNFHVVQTGRTTDWHYPLNNTLRIFDTKTTTKALQRLFALVRDCAGVVCPVTSGMHLAAAFGKPCVVIAGGREDPCWEAYNDAYRGFSRPFGGVAHRFLHTVGNTDPQLGCCRLAGCWRRNFEADGCDNATEIPSFPNRLANCMLALAPESVVQAIESYL